MPHFAMVFGFANSRSNKLKIELAVYFGARENKQ